MSQVMLTGRDSHREFCLRENAAAELRPVGTRFAFDLRHRPAKELVNEGADSRLPRRTFTQPEENPRRTRGRGTTEGDTIMLVLTRKPDETIRIGDDITITLLKTGHGRAKIGIEAPAHLRVLRGELAARDDAVLNLATESADGVRSPAWDVVHEIGNRELGT